MSVLRETEIKIGREGVREGGRKRERGNQVEAISVLVTLLGTHLSSVSKGENTEATSLGRSVSHIRAGGMGDL